LSYFKIKANLKQFTVGRYVQRMSAHWRI